MFIRQLNNEVPPCHRCSAGEVGHLFLAHGSNMGVAHWIVRNLRLNITWTVIGYTYDKVLKSVICNYEIIIRNYV